MTKSLLDLVGKAKDVLKTFQKDHAFIYTLIDLSQMDSFDVFILVPSRYETRDGYKLIAEVTPYEVCIIDWDLFFRPIPLN